LKDFYFVIFALPALVAILLLLAARRMGELSLKSGLILGSWYAVGFFLQYFGRSTTTWVIGLVMLAALAVYLAIRLRIGT
jgi:hypothetical protein